MVMGTILGIGATVIVAVAIWLIQERRNKNALRKQREGFLKDLREQLPAVIAEGLTKEHELRTGQPVTSDTKAKLVEAANTSATILSSYIDSETIKLSGTGSSLWVSIPPKQIDRVILVPDEDKPPQVKQENAIFVDPEEDEKQTL